MIKMWSCDYTCRIVELDKSVIPHKSTVIGSKTSVSAYLILGTCKLSTFICYLITVGRAIISKTYDKFWQGCGEMESLLLVGCKLVCKILKALQRIPKINIKIEFPSIIFVNMYLKNSLEISAQPYFFYSI